VGGDVGVEISVGAEVGESVGGGVGNADGVVGSSVLIFDTSQLEKSNNNPRKAICIRLE